ncbi:MAG: hypothetical protein AAB568_04240 [Patescibacteria group bacterium]
MEQKVIVLMASSMDEGGAKASLQGQIDKTLAEYRGWRVKSANTAIATIFETSCPWKSSHYVTTLVLEKVAEQGMQGMGISGL